MPRAPLKFMRTAAAAATGDDDDKSDDMNSVAACRQLNNDSRYKHSLALRHLSTAYTYYNVCVNMCVNDALRCTSIRGVEHSKSRFESIRFVVRIDSNRFVL